MAAAMVMLGAWLAHEPGRARRADGRSAGMRPSLPASTPPLNDRALKAGARSVSRSETHDAGLGAGAEGRTARRKVGGGSEIGRRYAPTVLTRGTLVIDVEACKGCELCIDACPPGVLLMTEPRSTPAGTAIRCCSRGARGAGRARRSAPTSCSRSTSTRRRSRFRPPERGVRVTIAEPPTRSAAAAGERGHRRGDGRRRVPLLLRVPDDPVHRGSRAHGPDAPRRGRGVHERRERARGGRHGVGRGRPPAPRRRPGRPGRVCR